MSNQVCICVPVCAHSVAELAREVARAAEAGESVEIRLDCLPQSELEAGVRVVNAALSGIDRPMIVTLRPAAEGGRRELEFSAREHFWAAQSQLLKPALLDVELDLVERFVATPPPRWDWDRVICSHHDVQGAPNQLQQLYERMASTPARILKVAVMANDTTDCLAVFDLLDRARRDGRELIAIAMGAAGVATRIMGPSRGAFLTYGALTAESGTAPGQHTAKELREVYRIDQIDRHTQITGLVGLPVGHSVSPSIHNAAFAALDMNFVYQPFEVRNLPAFIRRMVDSRTRELDWNLRGLSVTAPHKGGVIDYLDWTDPAAKEIGAVNTIIVDDDVLRGYNTDATTVLKPVLERLGTLREARCAIIGAGGAASAALWRLNQEGAKATVFARDPRRGNALAEKFSALFEPLDGVSFKSFDLVINATPLGTRGRLESETAAAASQLCGARLAYDLVYNPSETRFLRQASEAGCDTIGGLEMLVLQAAEQFTLWTGVEAPTDVMRDAAVQAVRSQSRIGDKESEISKPEVRQLTTDN